MTVAMWNPKRAALTHVALLLTCGHRVRLKRCGATYTVSGGYCPAVTFTQRED